MPSAGALAALYKEDNVLSLHTDAMHTASATGLPMTQTQFDASSEDMLKLIVSSLESDKAEEIVTIDLRDKSAMADYMVVCSGQSTRQVASLAEKLTARLKQGFSRNARVEGKDQGDWVLIDAGDVIIHVFRPEVREFYQLEKMWLPVGTVSAKA